MEWLMQNAERVWVTVSGARDSRHVEDLRASVSAKGANRAGPRNTPAELEDGKLNRIRLAKLVAGLKEKK